MFLVSMEEEFLRALLYLLLYAFIEERGKEVSASVFESFVCVVSLEDVW